MKCSTPCLWRRKRERESVFNNSMFYLGNRARASLDRVPTPLGVQAKTLLLIHTPPPGTISKRRYGCNAIPSCALVLCMQYCMHAVLHSHTCLQQPVELHLCSSQQHPLNTLGGREGIQAELKHSSDLNTTSIKRPCHPIQLLWWIHVHYTNFDLIENYE